jgi:oxygen-independent coproporphyrinogen-3 oxidase
MPNSLYIHIPFCIKKCGYCDFFSVSYNEPVAKSYINALCRELILKKVSTDKLKTVYIGGGTPSLLPDECFIELFQCLQDNFSLSHSGEITVEANPGTLREPGIHTVISLGVNRLSLGVQSFDDAELKTLGRIHTAEEALKSIELIKRAGMTNFSLDFFMWNPRTDNGLVAGVALKGGCFITNSHISI